VQRELGKARVPALYADAVWELVRSPAVKHWCVGIPARCHHRVDPGPPNYALLGHGMMIIGPTGTGKSSAAALTAKAVVEAGKTIAWRYVPDLLDAMSGSAVTRLPEIKRLTAVDVMFLDDFGVRQIADWEVGYLDQIVEARYRARKPMVLTTNLTTRQIQEDGRLDRMVDRWKERTASNLVVLSGESMRDKAKGTI
jgi:DNA replication protein DnaC